eukprot:GEMP01050518.1.p1 GENE.GEMP01050518.1~~GEMP01050518.1.p1  ORF type:complete len:346 (+),score=52.10 GEMP01050518.1:150-1187(+)
MYTTNIRRYSSTLEDDDSITSWGMKTGGRVRQATASWRCWGGARFKRTTICLVGLIVIFGFLSVLLLTRPTWDNPKARRKNVVIMTVAANGLDLVRANAYHFMAHDFDMILGHYDMQRNAYLHEPWYTEDLVVLVKEGQFHLKFQFWEQIYDNHQSLLEQYDYILIPDVDFLWTPVNLTCFVKNANGFGVVGPAVVGPHRTSEQDASFVHKGKQCSIRTVNDIEVQAPMFPRKNLKLLKDLLLPENHGSDGALETDWGLDFVWCNYMKSCIVYETCGNPIHVDTKTLNKNKEFNEAAYRNLNSMRKEFPQFLRHVDNATIPDRLKCYSSVPEALSDLKKQKVEDI